MIRIADVRKHAYNPAAPPVLDGVSLQLGAGESFGLCGPGASGKSLLLKILCGLVRPERGSVDVAGVAMHSPGGQVDHRELMRARAQIGMLFQNNALFDSLTVAENVAFPLQQRAAQAGQRLDAAGEAALREQAIERLREVGLAEHRDKMPSQLSGGQRKRVALARAVIARPKVLIYDEPTAGLDPVTTSKIYDLLQAERAAVGATVVVVSSDVDALRRFVPRMGMLYKGRLRYDGPTEGMEGCDDAVVRQFVRGALEGPL